MTRPMTQADGGAAGAAEEAADGDEEPAERGEQDGGLEGVLEHRFLCGAPRTRRLLLLNALGGVAGSARAPGSAPAGAGEPRVLGASRAGRAPGVLPTVEFGCLEGLSRPTGGPQRRTAAGACAGRVDDDTQRDTPHSGCDQSAVRQRRRAVGAESTTREPVPTFAADKGCMPDGSGKSATASCIGSSPFRNFSRRGGSWPGWRCWPKRQGTSGLVELVEQGGDRPRDPRRGRSPTATATWRPRSTPSVVGRLVRRSGRKSTPTVKPGAMPAPSTSDVEGPGRRTAPRPEVEAPFSGR